MWKKCCCACFQDSEEADVDVQSLDYNHSSLAQVPPEIFTYERTLEKLDLSSNQIKDLPPNLFHCHELRELNINDNEIKLIPFAIESLTHLTKFEASRNGLEEVPETIAGCKNLVYLDLTMNCLNKVPEAICHLVSLEELFLNDTSLEFLPANFGRLTRLKTLELRDNRLQTLPKSMNRLLQLQKLDIGANEMEELPEVIGTMTNLTELWVDNNAIREVPKFIGNLTKLVCLDLSKNEIGELAPDIGKCIHLEDLSISFNSITHLPDAFCKLENVVTIRMDSNCISSLPDGFGKLKNLQEFSINSNMLSSIPASVGLLRKLHTAYLDDNRMTDMPKEIGSCTSLAVLSIASNSLVEVPSEVGHLSNLKILNLTNNAIRNLPVSILSLSNLGALWLTDKQNKPLVTLNKEVDSSTGQYVVTCCLLPQIPTLGAEAACNETIGEEPRRSKRRIRFNDEEEAPPQEKPIVNGGLLRAPTPYPKELRAMARHVSQLRTSRGQNGGPHSQQQNEPVYDGDRQEELKELNARLGERMRQKRYTTGQPQPQAGCSTNSFAPTWRAQSNEVVDIHPSSDQGKKHGIPPMIDASDAAVKLASKEPSIAVDQASLDTRTPPPYHIAAKRAAFLRSSGGAGSGKMNYPTSESPAISGRSIPPTASHALGDPMEVGHYLHATDESLELSRPGSYSEHIPGLPEPAGYHLDKASNNNYPATEKGDEPVPDKNANTSSNPMFKLSDILSNANLGYAESESRVEKEQEEQSTVKEMVAQPEVRKHSSFRESRIPTSSFYGTKSASATPLKNPSFGFVANVSPTYELPVTSPPSPISHNKTTPQRKIGGASMQYAPLKGLQKASRPSTSVSYMRTPDTPKVKTSSLSMSEFKANFQSRMDGNSDICDGAPQGSQQEGRKSRIPKFGAVKEEERCEVGETEKEGASAQELEELEKLKSPRSGIPKLSAGRGETGGAAGLSGRKPWIFGSHKNARVESVEYRKVSADQLGFSIAIGHAVDENGAPTTSPDGTGIYVLTTDSADLPIKAGDKILQIDGIDVDVNSMGVTIVSKILANCQENIQFLVSRQQ